MSKANNIRITKEFLDRRAEISIKAGYSKQKWIEFCETLLSEGYKLSLYEARRTVSKYITVMRKGRRNFKVRFSNHRPIHNREIAGDCDFFVGVCNTRTTTTAQALIAVRNHFNEVKDEKAV